MTVVKYVVTVETCDRNMAVELQITQAILKEYYCRIICYV